MKSNAFLVAIFLLIAGGIFMFTNTGKQVTEKLTLNESAPVDTKPVEVEIKKEITPADWRELLVGTWDFYYSRKSSKSLHYFDGEVEYRADGTFIKYVNHKYYIPQYSHYVIGQGKDILAVEEGGNIEGKWKVLIEKGVWEESTSRCKLSRSFTFKDHSRKKHIGYYPCKRDFRGVIQYGTHNTTVSKLSLNYFKKNLINITGRNFKEGSAIVMDFSKKED